MITQIELKDIVKKLDKFIKFKISDEVCIIKYKNKNYILKKIVIPFSNIEMKSQHNYISYLLKNSISVETIICTVKYKNNFYELKKVIKNNYRFNLFNTISSIILISKMHNISRDYILKKKGKYEFYFQCNCSNLNNLLLGFKEKYNVFPLKQYNLYKNNIDCNLNNKLYKLIQIYQNVYLDFTQNNNIKSCIIHNDISENNILHYYFKNYLIDFDCCIKSSEYVDFIDLVIRRYNSLDYINSNFNRIIKKIKKYIKIYNKYNKKKKLELMYVLEMFILKIMSYNLYVLFNEEMKNIFINNFNELESLIYKLNETIKKEKNEKFKNQICERK